MHEEYSFQILVESIHPEKTAGGRKVILEKAIVKYMGKCQLL
jgi:hypothetical protein